MAESVASPFDLVLALRAIVAAPEATLRLIVASAIAGGHLLLEDVPGVGKTLLAKSFAEALGLGFRRVQFSPDLLPGDLTGVQVYVPSDGSFRFVPGPIFSHVLLADEINRASPRAQAGLLEAMEEGQVSVEGVTRSLPDPFFVIATQNPLSFEGTYPLPEVQLDRFTAALSLGYPSYEDELSLMEGRHGYGIPVQAVPAGSLQGWRETARRVRVDPTLRAYVLGVVRASRTWPEVRLGISPRGALAWQAMARAIALIEGRAYAVPDDLKLTAPAVLSHRLVLEKARSGEHKRQVIGELLAREPVPR